MGFHNRLSDELVARRQPSQARRDDCRSEKGGANPIAMGNDGMPMGTGEMVGMAMEELQALFLKPIMTLLFFVALSRARSRLQRLAPMRIVGGRLKGRVLSAPASRAIRPTSERLREFRSSTSWSIEFTGHIEGARVVDVFAGTGALAIEALSRGAQLRAVRRQRRRGARASAGQCRGDGAWRVTRIWRADATRLRLSRQPAAHFPRLPRPPYGQGLAAPALASLVEGGWLNRERFASSRRAPRPTSPHLWSRTGRRAHVRRHKDRDLSGRRPNGELAWLALSNRPGCANVANRPRRKFRGRQLRKPVRRRLAFSWP